VKVVASIDAGLIALLNVAVTLVLGHAPDAPVGGITDITEGGVNVGLVSLLPGSPHAIMKTSSNAVK
jgi:hypothetical protein